MRRSTSFLIVMVAILIAVVLQAVALGRHIDRLPDDWVGIGLYSAALVGFALAAVGFAIQWRRARQQEAAKEDAGPDR